ncbi:MAG TPA: MaoC/PaaZ C-terminal domain-containing protein [Ensifer sp.]|nr:MaoC/PaaZ C-terminal domain-containing protein [Ensifer sp.]
MRFDEIWPQNTVSEIGSYHFTAEKIIEFAAKFDPQYFHLDAERAKESVLGGLCASGWHVCSAWMGLNVAFLFAEFGRLAKAGHQHPKMGPALGFRELRWRLPVFAGDTVDFTNTLIRSVKAPNHADRLLHDVYCEGRNQDGKIVVNFTPTVIEFI